jgi:predicted P-loop ATPase
VTGRSEFFRALFQEGSEGYFHLLSVLPREGDRALTTNVRVSLRNFDGVDKFAKTWETRNLYFGVAVRRAESDGQLANCVSLSALFSEVDFKDFGGDEAAARQKIASFPVPPGIIVASGGGLHCYWLLDQPLLLDEPDRAKRLLRALATATGGDLSAAEPARVLRIPGTRNIKYDPPRDVTIESFNGQRMPLAAIEQHLTLEAAKPARTKKRVGTISDGARNDLLFREACRLREFGHSEDEILALLKVANTERVQPPLQDREVVAIARSASRYQAGERDGFDLYTTGARKGEIRADSQQNVRLAVAQLGVSLRYNAFAAKVLVGYQEQEAPLDDAKLHRIWLTIDEQFGFRPTLEFFQIVLTDLAHRNQFHPVRDYVVGLQWDGVERIDNWLTTYAGVASTSLSQAVGAIFLTAAVRRVTKPGCKFDELMILESPQGTNKSSMLKALCPEVEWFSDDLPLGVDSKQLIERTSGKWIIEASELHGYSNADVEKLKAQLSRQTDGPVRLAYARVPVEVARQFVPAGTGNPQAHYLRDATGNRRFWPFKVTQCDVDAVLRDRDQLWAEAVVREASGASIRLPEELWAAAAEEQESRRAVDPFEDLLEEQGIDFTRDAICVEELWMALGGAGSYRKNNDADRLAKIVQRHGFTRRKKVTKVYVHSDGRREEGKRQWAWVRNGADPSTIDVPIVTPAVSNEGGNDGRMQF